MNIVHTLSHHSLRLASPPIGNDHQGTVSRSQMIGLSVSFTGRVLTVYSLYILIWHRCRVHHVHIKKKKKFLGRWVVCTARQHVHIMCLDASTYGAMINLSVLVGWGYYIMHMCIIIIICVDMVCMVWRTRCLCALRGLIWQPATPGRYLDSFPFILPIILRCKLTRYMYWVCTSTHNTCACVHVHALVPVGLALWVCTSGDWGVRIHVHVHM